MSDRKRQYQITVPIEKAVSVDEIEMADRQAGGHFFDPKTMRAWGSRIQYAIPVKLGADKRTLYFVTSEKYPNGDNSYSRAYNVRKVTIEADGDVYISTMKGGAWLNSANAARKFMASNECP